IRAPYLLEGSLYGGIAAVIALIVFYPALAYVSPKVGIIMPGVSLMDYFVRQAPLFIPLLVIIGVMLGVISSMVAIRRFLKI
ncbi:MAG: hypothetical protein KW806_02545, partial [Candidatus Yanofskybacteria bacterium]|nr:hypothetical protein [Candidatus Yanofskybacteria bacterium]